MIMLGATDPTRCHSYNTTNVRRKTGTRHIWVCNSCSNQMLLSPIRHRKMIGKISRFWMAGCKHHGGYTYNGLEGSSAKLEFANDKNRRANNTKRSKLDICKSIYDPNASRNNMIKMFINEGGCTKAGTATYYAKIKKEARQ